VITKPYFPQPEEQMFCSLCGANNADNSQTCTRCGASMLASAAPAFGVPASPQLPPGQAETSGKAVASLVCGIFFFFLPAAIVAVILGHVSLSEIRRSGGRLVGDGMAIAGLILGYIGFAAIPVILIIAAVAIPNLLRARMAANEATAVGSLRAINTAAISYSAAYPNGFPPSLDSLGGSGAATCDHAELIDPMLASGQKSGYVFSYGLVSQTRLAPRVSPQAIQAGCDQAGGTGYAASADPISRGTTGERSFYTDQTGIIRYDPNGAATADSPPLE
jgi:type IV pilus assembly protein PilA